MGASLLMDVYRFDFPHHIQSSDHSKCLLNWDHRMALCVCRSEWEDNSVLTLGGSPAPGRASHEEPAADQPFSVAGNIMKPDLKCPKERAPPSAHRSGQWGSYWYTVMVFAAMLTGLTTIPTAFCLVRFRYNIGRRTRVGQYPHSARPSSFAKAMADRSPLEPTVRLPAPLVPSGCRAPETLLIGSRSSGRPWSDIQRD
jgi:hypothetical protein